MQTTAVTDQGSNRTTFTPARRYRLAAAALLALMLVAGVPAAAAADAAATPYNTPSPSWQACTVTQLTSTGCSWTAPFDPWAAAEGYSGTFTSNTRAQWDDYYYCNSSYWDQEVWPDIVSSNLWGSNTGDWGTVQADGKTMFEDSGYTISTTPVAGDLDYVGGNADYVEAVLDAGNSLGLPAGTIIVSGVGPESATCEQHTGWYGALTPAEYQNLPWGGSVIFVSDPNQSPDSDPSSGSSSGSSTTTSTSTAPTTAPARIPTGLRLTAKKLKGGALTFKLAAAKGFTAGPKTGTLTVTSHSGKRAASGRIASGKSGHIRLPAKGRWRVTVAFKPCTGSKYRAWSKSFTETVRAR